MVTHDRYFLDRRRIASSSWIGATTPAITPATLSNPPSARNGWSRRKRIGGGCSGGSWNGCAAARWRTARSRRPASASQSYGGFRYDSQQDRVAIYLAGRRLGKKVLKRVVWRKPTAICKCSPAWISSWRPVTASASSAPTARARAPFWISWPECCRRIQAPSPGVKRSARLLRSAQRGARRVVPRHRFYQGRGGADPRPATGIGRGGFRERSASRGCGLDAGVVPVTTTAGLSAPSAVASGGRVLSAHARPSAQRPAARRADQRSGHPNPQRWRIILRSLQRLCGGGQPRPLLPRPCGGSAG